MNKKVVGVAVGAIAFCAVGFLGIRLLLGSGAGWGRSAACLVIETRGGARCSIVPELDKICAIATEVQTKSFPSTEAQMKWLQHEIIAMGPSRRLSRLMKAIGQAAPEKKLSMWYDAAKADGAPEWRCSGLAALYEPPKPKEAHAASTSVSPDAPTHPAPKPSK